MLDDADPIGTTVAPGNTIVVTLADGRLMGITPTLLKLTGLPKLPKLLEMLSVSLLHPYSGYESGSDEGDRL